MLWAIFKPRCAEFCPDLFITIMQQRSNNLYSQRGYDGHVAPSSEVAFSDENAHDDYEEEIAHEGQDGPRKKTRLSSVGRPMCTNCEQCRLCSRFYLCSQNVQSLAQYFFS